MKVYVYYKNDNKKKFQHVRFAAAYPKDNSLWILRYTYSSNTRNTKEENINLDEVDRWSAEHAEKGGW